MATQKGDLCNRGQAAHRIMIKDNALKPGNSTAFIAYLSHKCIPTRDKQKGLPVSLFN
ncbi:MAG: hypothetical protein WKF97_04950 [Chitinophagaceae bacterium]